MCTLFTVNLHCGTTAIIFVCALVLHVNGPCAPFLRSIYTVILLQSYLASSDSHVPHRKYRTLVVLADNAFIPHSTASKRVFVASYQTLGELCPNFALLVLKASCPSVMFHIQLALLCCQYPFSSINAHNIADGRARPDMAGE